MALQYKLIVSDFDGTLTREDGTVPAENIAAIRRYCNAGGIFTVSTGRMYGSIIKQLSKIGLCSAQTGSTRNPAFPIVSYQGALITDAVSGRVLHSVTMDRAVVRKAVSYCKAHNLYCHFYSFDRFYTERMTERSRSYAAYTNAEELAVEAGDLVQYLDAHPELPVCKVLMIDEPGRIEQIGREVNAFFAGEAVFVRSAAYLTECVDGNAGKGNALRWLADYYGIDPGEVLAMGDSENDLSMITAAGLGVAMGNACENLKRNAGFVTDSCNSGGFYKVIDKVLDGTI